MLLSVLSFLGGSLGLTTIFKKKIEFTIPLFCLLSIFFLYLFGIFGVLAAGVYVIYGLGIIGFLSALIFAIKNKAIRFNPSIVVFAFFMILAWWAQKGRLLSSFDEFSHWGLTVKNIYYFNMLPNHAQSSVRFTGYPPGTALLQYFFAKGAPGYADASLFTAHNVFYFCAMMPLFQNIRKKGLFKTLITVILVLIVPIVFYQNFFVEIYVDAMLGVLFAYSLIVYFTTEPDLFKTLNISFALLVLCIVKASGQGLAILALIIMLIDALRFRRDTLKPYNEAKMKKLCRILCPALFVFVASCSWEIYLKLTGTPEAWDTTGVTLKAFTDVFLLGHGTEVHMTVIGNFINAFFESHTTGFYFNSSLVGSIAILALVYFGYSKFNANQQGIRRYHAFSVSIFAGFFIYAFSLLVLYLFAFSVGEATDLASFGRYIGTYLIGTLIFIISLMIIYDKERNNKNTFTILVALLLIITVNLQPLLEITVMRSASVKVVTDKMSSLDGISEVKVYSDMEDKTYFVNPGGTPYISYVSNYYLTPYMMGREPWSFGTTPYSDEDRYFNEISAEEWEQTLFNEYQFVYVYDTCPQFETLFGHLFKGGAVKAQTAYRVEKSGRKVVLVEAD